MDDINQENEISNVRDNENLTADKGSMAINNILCAIAAISTLIKIDCTILQLTHCSSVSGVCTLAGTVLCENRFLQIIINNNNKCSSNL